MALHSIELFAGAGGLSLGLERLGVRTVCYVEREAYAAGVLAARMEDGGLDPAPIWSDVTTFDARRWRGVVDIVAGGFPCQDVSRVGRRAGVENGAKSGLWREFARVVLEAGPRVVYVENVANLNRHGIDHVLGDLAAMGFDAEWGVLGADSAGAHHLRKRTFIMAYAPGVSGVLQDEVQAGRNSSPGGSRWAPEPGVGRVADGVACQVDRLRSLGNGVVPQQAELAFRLLLDRAVRSGSRLTP